MITIGSALTVHYRATNWSANVFGIVVNVSADGTRGELSCEGRGLVFWFTADDIVCEGREEESAEAVAERRRMADMHDRQQEQAGRLWGLRNEAAKRGDTFAVWRLERQLEVASHAE